jgi:hypothetical protein
VPRPAIADAVADFVMLATSSKLMFTRPGPARLLDLTRATRANISKNFVRRLVAVAICSTAFRVRRLDGFEPSSEPK